MERKINKAKYKEFWSLKKNKKFGLLIQFAVKIEFIKISNSIEKAKRLETISYSYPIRKINTLIISNCGFLKTKKPFRQRHFIVEEEIERALEFKWCAS